MSVKPSSDALLAGGLPSFEVQYDLTPIHEQSVEVMELFQDNGINVGLGVMAAALTLARLMHPDPATLTPELEVAATQALVEFAGAYWTGGGVN